MMVVPKTIPFAIELKSEDNGLAGVAHLKLESAIKDLSTPFIRSELWDCSIQFFRKLGFMKDKAVEAVAGETAAAAEAPGRTCGSRPHGSRCR